MEDIPTRLLCFTVSGSSTDDSVGMGCGQCSSNMGAYDMVKSSGSLRWLEDWVLVAHGETIKSLGI